MGISLVVGALASGPVGRRLHASRVLAFALIASVGLVAAATLTPSIGGSAPHPGQCDMSRIGLVPLDELLRVGEATENILLFVPLGICVALLPASRARTILAVAAVAFPFAIEGTQLLLPALNRSCESADVVDNLSGLVVGGFVAAVGRLAYERRPARK